jgi:hypothetical protein
MNVNPSRILCGVGISLLGVACGSTPDAASTSDGPSDADRVAAEGQVRAAYSEASCGTTAPDKTFVTNTDEAVTTGPFTHATCTNAFIVEDTNTSATQPDPDPRNPPLVQTAYVLSGEPGGNSSFTPWDWVYAALWQKTATGFVKVTEDIQWGRCTVVATPSSPFGRQECFVPSAAIPVPTAGDYKLVAAEGFLFFPGTKLTAGFQYTSQGFGYADL